MYEDIKDLRLSLTHTNLFWHSLGTLDSDYVLQAPPTPKGLIKFHMTTLYNIMVIRTWSVCTGNRNTLKWKGNIELKRRTGLRLLTPRLINVTSAPLCTVIMCCHGYHSPGYFFAAVVLGHSLAGCIKWFVHLLQGGCPHPLVVCWTWFGDLKEKGYVHTSDSSVILLQHSFAHRKNAWEGDCLKSMLQCIYSCPQLSVSLLS